MQIIIPPLLKTRKMGSESLQTLRTNENHSKEATRSRQHKAVLPKKNLTLFRLSFAYHTRLVLKFFYAPQDHAGFGNTAYKTHREEQVLKDIVTLQPASELPATVKQWEHNHSLGTPPPFPGIKDKPPHTNTQKKNPFCPCHILQGFRSKLLQAGSSLPGGTLDCLTIYRNGTTRQQHTTPKTLLPRTDSALLQRLWASLPGACEA